MFEKEWVAHPPHCHQGRDRKQSCHLHRNIPPAVTFHTEFQREALLFLQKIFLPYPQLPNFPSPGLLLKRASGLWSFVHHSAKGRVMDPRWKFQLNLAKREIFVTLHLKSTLEMCRQIKNKPVPICLQNLSTVTAT